MKKNSLKKSFTLVEVIISIVILGIMFTYLYTTINSTKKLNANYITKSDVIKDEKQIFKLFNLDFAQIIGSVKITHSKKYDVVVFKTKNSIYQIIEPTVTYFVSKKDKALIRVESLKPFSFDVKEKVDKVFLYADILVSDTISFKASHKDGFISILFRSKTLRPMVLKIPTIS